MVIESDNIPGIYCQYVSFMKNPFQLKRTPTSCPRLPSLLISHLKKKSSTQAHNLITPICNWFLWNPSLNYRKISTLSMWSYTAHTIHHHSNQSYTHCTKLVDPVWVGYHLANRTAHAKKIKFVKKRYYR